jgi:hypothetical protein
MKRTPFKSRRIVKSEGPNVDREPRAMSRLPVVPNYGGGTTGPAPKGEKAKPGKRAPTVEERRWLDAIVSHGCVACEMDGTLVQGSDGVYEPRRPQVHHILRGGRRMGHLWTLPLCDGHHQHGTGAPGLIARHPTKAQFEHRYGSEDFLLAKLRAEIGGTK